jgi:glycosyltransferase involved in cell wall biosynthesis
VDDGSAASARETLAKYAERHPWLRVEWRPHNGGKGAALKTGYRLAMRLGYTHALQLDADGQHDANDLPKLLQAAASEPEALVLAAPILIGAPRARRYGRLLSRYWVWVETASFAIRDPLCGLRCMPLVATLGVLDEAPCGERMDFDPEIAVRLAWRGVTIVNVPSRVVYAAGGVSHFDTLWDNLRITWLHVRLVTGMLVRLPGWLLGRRT